MISIAIDGPSGAGKSSLSRRLAAELGYIYVDTGAMYRTIGLHVLRSGADTEDEDAVAALLPGIRLEMRYVDGVQHMFLNGEDVSGLIRTEEVSMAASHVSAHPSVRAFLLDAQRALAKDNNVLMDGRDIGTVVLPGAQVKIFLTASAGDRARRRYDELIARGEWVSYEQVLADVERRDYNDTHRAAAPLRPAADAVTVDTTGFTFDDAFALLLFYMICRSTVRATAFPPAQGIRITRRGYVVRYMLTAVFVIAAIKLPYLNAAAAVIPLFFTKALLLWRHAVQRKGG